MCSVEIMPTNSPCSSSLLCADVEYACLLISNPIADFVKFEFISPVLALHAAVRGVRHRGLRLRRQGRLQGHPSRTHGGFEH